MQGLGQSYLSSSELTSTVNGLGSSYMSSAGFILSNATFQGKLYTQTQLLSSIMNLGTKGYISVASATSTFQGLAQSGAYISSASLVSTVQGFPYTTLSSLTSIVAIAQATISNATPTTLQTVVNTAGQTYISSYYIYSDRKYAAAKPILTSTTAGITTSLGGQPGTVTNSISFPDITTNPTNSICIFGSNSVSYPSKIKLQLNGAISFCNIYCYQGITAARFTASNYYADGTKILSGSDRRLKQEIVPLSNAIRTIQALEGVSYTLKETRKRQIGFIAQDVERILPELVTTAEYKSLNYPPISVVVLEAIKELNAECDELLRILNLF